MRQLLGVYAGVNALVGEVIPTRVLLTFSQAQNMIADIAIERNYTFYFWGHSDVALLASNASAVFAEEVRSSPSASRTCELYKLPFSACFYTGSSELSDKMPCEIFSRSGWLRSNYFEFSVAATLQNKLCKSKEAFREPVCEGGQLVPAHACRRWHAWRG